MFVNVIIISVSSVLRESRPYCHACASQQQQRHLDGPQQMVLQLLPPLLLLLLLQHASLTLTRPGGPTGRPHPHHRPRLHSGGTRDTSGVGVRDVSQETTAPTPATVAQTRWRPLQQPSVPAAHTGGGRCGRSQRRTRPRRFGRCLSEHHVVRGRNGQLPWWWLWNWGFWPANLHRIDIANRFCVIPAAHAATAHTVATTATSAAHATPSSAAQRPGDLYQSPASADR